MKPTQPRSNEEKENGIVLFCENPVLRGFVSGKLESSGILTFEVARVADFYRTLDVVELHDIKVLGVLTDTKIEISHSREIEIVHLEPGGVDLELSISNLLRQANRSKVFFH